MSEFGLDESEEPGLDEHVWSWELDKCGDDLSILLIYRYVLPVALLNTYLCSTVRYCIS